MRQFYKTYQEDEKVTPLLRQLPWTHNLLILSRSKRPEEREFYLRMALRERWSKRELERQLNGALFERVVLSSAKVSPPVTQLHPDAAAVIKDSYLLDFLNLPDAHSEDDLQRALVANLRQFLRELGGDFTFVGERYRLQVGGRDFFVDLLFYHRSLTCLVAFRISGSWILLAWLLSVNHGVRHHTMLFLPDRSIGGRRDAEPHSVAVDFNDPNDDVVTNDQSLIHTAAYDDHDCLLAEGKALSQPRAAAGLFYGRQVDAAMPGRLAERRER